MRIVNPYKNIKPLIKDAYINNISSNYDLKTSNNIYKKHSFTTYPGQGNLFYIKGEIDKCLERCDSLSSCNGFVRVYSDNGCWLKDHSPYKAEYDKNVDYFYKTNLSSLLPPATIPTYEYLVKNNYNTIPEKTEDLAIDYDNVNQCKTKCNFLPYCIGFAYDKKNFACIFKKDNLDLNTLKSDNTYDFYYKNIPSKQE